MSSNRYIVLTILWSICVPLSAQTPPTVPNPKVSTPTKAPGSGIPAYAPCEKIPTPRPIPEKKNIRKESTTKPGSSTFALAPETWIIGDTRITLPAGETPESAYEKVVSFIASHNARINESDAKLSPEQKALRSAFVAGDRARVLSLLDKPSLNVDFTTHFGFHPMFCAVSWGDVQLVKRLIKHGALSNPAGQPFVIRAVATALYDDRPDSFDQRLRILKLLAEGGADIDAIADDKSALDYATWYLYRGPSYDTRNSIPLDKRLALTRFLIDSKADLNRVSPHGPWTTLSRTIDKPALLALLLKNGADPKLNDGFALLQAIADENLEATKMLLAYGAPANARLSGSISKPGKHLTFRSHTPALAIAVMSNTPEIAKLLLEHGADPDACLNQIPDEICRLPDVPVLERALLADIRGQGRGISELLLKHGADPNKSLEDGRTVLHSMLKYRPVGKVRVWNNGTFVDKTIDPDDAVKTRANIIALLLAHGADPNLKFNGQTALMMAPEGDTRITQALLDAGGRIEPDTNDKKLSGIEAGPLTWCLAHGRFDLLEALLDNGTPITARDRRVVLLAVTPFHHRELPDGVSYESEEQRIHIVRRLLEAGANANIRGQQRQTALHEAVSEREFELAGVLLEHGADINARTLDMDEWKKREPEAAAKMIQHRETRRSERKKHLDELSWLQAVRLKRTLRALDLYEYPNPGSGYTPLMIAVSNQDATMTKMLLDAGARKDLESSDGYTAKDIARMFGNKELIKLF